MPKEWYDFHSLIVKDSDDEETVQKKGFNKRILAEKKPYFMRYIYPELNALFNRKNNNMTFNYDVQPDFDPEKQAEYDEWRTKKLPVSDGNCVMNRLCHYVEQEFKRIPGGSKDKNYPYQELLGGENYNFNARKYDIADKLKKLYSEYRKQSKEDVLVAKIERLQDEQQNEMRNTLSEQFERDCRDICCSNEVLCDLLLKLCYKSNSSKRFVWAMCGDQIVQNLLEKNGRYSYFVRDDEGEIVYNGERYKRITEDNDNTED